MDEQKARGKELLRLLWEPQSPCVAKVAPAPVTQVTPFETGRCYDCQDSDVEVRVKNTFVELVRTSNKGTLRRCRSDSDLSKLTCDTAESRSGLQEQRRPTPEVLSL